MKFDAIADAAAVIAAFLRILSMVISYETSVVVTWILAIVAASSTALLGIWAFAP